jgi:hypothetical protein
MAAAFVPFLLMGAQALSGALANKSKTSTTTQNTTQNQTQSGTNKPLYDEGQLDVRNFLLRELMGGVESTPDFAKNYTAQGISNINRGADATSNNIRNAMLSRGLGRTSAGLSPEVANENVRFGQLSQFQNSVPLKIDEMQRARMRDLSQFFAALPVGTSQNQTSNTTGNMTGTQTTPNNALAGGLGGLSQMGAFLYGQGAFGNNGGGNIPSSPKWIDPYDPEGGTQAGGRG